MPLTKANMGCLDAHPDDHPDRRFYDDILCREIRTTPLRFVGAMVYGVANMARDAAEAARLLDALGVRVMPAGTTKRLQCPDCRTKLVFGRYRTRMFGYCDSHAGWVLVS